jgi:hypothetical protein
MYLIHKLTGHRYAAPSFVAKTPCGSVVCLHHARVSIRNLFERKCLDQRADILQNAEREGSSV